MMAERHTVTIECASACSEVGSCETSQKTGISQQVAFSMAPNLKTLTSYLNNFTTINLHQLLQVLLQQVGVRSPFQKSQEINWKTEKMLYHGEYLLLLTLPNCVQNKEVYF